MFSLCLIHTYRPVAYLVEPTELPFRRFLVHLTPIGLPQHLEPRLLEHMIS